MDEGQIKKTPCIFKKLIHRAYEKKKRRKKKRGKTQKNTWEFFLLGLSLLRDLKDLSRIRVKRLHLMHNDGPVSPILFFIIAELTSLIIQKKFFKYPLKQKIGNL